MATAPRCALPAAKAETAAASPQGIGFASAPSTGATPDVPLGRQVASALGGVVSDLRSDTSGSEAEGNLRLRAGGAALKTIQIQLQPAHFGKLDVTMKLVDGHLAIQLLASEPETVMRLKDDTDGLKSLLNQSGFTVDEAAISIALRDPGQPRSGAVPGLADNAAASTDGRGASDGASRDEAQGQRGAAGRSGRDGGTDGGGRASADPQSARRDLDPSIYL
jgi:flagellar hook-length control protein FliK